jgi:hypothetical protein
MFTLRDDSRMSSPTIGVYYMSTANSDREENLKTADRRIERLQQEYTERGYLVLINKNFNAGVDLIIILRKTGTVKKVIEATNYKAKWEYISDEKLGRYINSLKFFDQLPNVEKELVVSFEDNLTDDQIKRLGQNKINVKIVGRQD